MKFQNVKISGTRRVTLEVHPAADAFPLVEGAELEALVEDVRQHGFRHPIVIKGDTLIDGRNRLRVGQKLGIDPPVSNLGDAIDVLEYIISTNIHRRHLTESQRAMIAATLATLGHGANQHTTARTGALAGPPTQAAAAKRLQVGERSVRDAVKVRDRGAPELVDAVKGGQITVSAAAKVAELSPAEQRALVEKVTAKGGGEVKPGRVKALAQQQAKRDTVARINKGLVRPLPIGPFRLLVADYPWPYDNSDNHEGSRGHIDYPPMPLPDIIRHARDDVSKVALEDSILGLWVTNAFLPFVPDVVHAAGFTWRTMITWDKLHAGLGMWPRGQTEHLVIASRGKPVHTLNELTTLHREAPREHSRKPDALMDLLVAHCPGPHLELFARAERPGWVSWGAEVGKFHGNSGKFPGNSGEFPAGSAAPAPPATATEPSLADICPKCDREYGEHQGKRCPPGAAAELPAAAAPAPDELDEPLDEPWTCDCGHLNTFRILDGVVEVCGNCEEPRRPPRHEPAPEQLAEPWTCRGRPMKLMGAECGYVNTVRTVDGEGASAGEVCGKCGCVRPRHGSPGKPAKPATVAKHEASFQAAKTSPADKPSKRRPLSSPAPAAKGPKRRTPAPAASHRDLKPGDMILVRWQPGTTKRARFVRLTKAGDLVANIQAVDAKGVYLKKFGSDRTFRVADYAGRAT
jgi:N6-adenosine-specific RNA methylase IME4